MGFSGLADFTRWFLSQPIGALRIPDLPVSRLTLGTTDGPGSDVTGVVLYRNAPYQVEMFSLHARQGGTTVPVHRHPNVDSFEFFLSGGVNFILNKRRFRIQPPPQLSAEKAPWLGALLSVRAKDWHGAAVESAGGSFLSIQKWKKGIEPTSVTLDWVGPPHASQD